jgi:hypothetical protein
MEWLLVAIILGLAILNDRNQKENIRQLKQTTFNQAKFIEALKIDFKDKQKEIEVLTLKYTSLVKTNEKLSRDLDDQRSITSLHIDSLVGKL